MATVHFIHEALSIVFSPHCNNITVSVGTTVFEVHVMRLSEYEGMNYCFISATERNGSVSK